MTKSDLRMAVLLILFSLLSLFWLIPLNTSSSENALDLSPSFMPSFAAATMLLLGFVFAYQSAVKVREDDRILEDEEFGSEATGLGRREGVNLLLWTLFSALIVSFMDWFGYQAVSTVSLVVLMWFSGQRRPVILITVGMGAPIVIWHAAWNLLSRELPVWTIAIP